MLPTGNMWLIDQKARASEFAPGVQQATARKGGCFNRELKKIVLNGVS